MRLDADKETQKLSVTWEDGHASTFDVEILRTELMEIVLNVSEVLRLIKTVF